MGSKNLSLLLEIGLLQSFFFVRLFFFWKNVPFFLQNFYNDKSDKALSILYWSTLTIGPLGNRLRPTIYVRKNLTFFTHFFLSHLFCRNFCSPHDFFLLSAIRVFSFSDLQEVLKFPSNTSSQRGGFKLPITPSAHISDFLPLFLE